MLTSITPGSGVTLKLQARGSPGGVIAFDEDRLVLLLGRILERRHEVEIVLHALCRRHEDVEMAVARFEGHRGAHDAGTPNCRRRDPGPCWGPARGAMPRGAPSASPPASPAKAGSWRRRTGARRNASSGGRSGCGAIGSGWTMMSVHRRAPPRAANRAAGGSRSANRRGSGSISPSAGTTVRSSSVGACASVPRPLWPCSRATGST
jgi:hypothetical protein